MIKNYILFSLIALLPVMALSQKTISCDLILRSNFGTATMWDNKTIRIYGFSKTLGGSPSLPGPTLYLEEGDSLLLNAANISQTHVHTVHLHGMDADTKNDGDPMTTHPILHGSTKTYRLLAKNAGTYLYHCHVEDVVHVQMGMYGLIIVKAAGGAKTAWTGGPSFNSTYHWLTSEIDKSWHDTIPQAKNDTLRVPAYHPNYFLVNGKSEQQIDADDSIKIRGSQNEFIYLRIANIGYFNNRVIFPAGLKAKMIDSDGRPLPHALVRDTVELLPGERYGMMLNPLTQFTDSVKISYVNCNTDSVWNNQYIPVIISGIYAVNSIDHPAWFSVFPNPAKEVINLQNNTGKIYSNASVCLINLLGETVMEEKKETFNQTVSLHISHVPSGLYYLQINVGNEVYRKKIIISK